MIWRLALACQDLHSGPYTPVAHLRNCLLRQFGKGIGHWDADWSIQASWLSLPWPASATKVSHRPHSARASLPRTIMSVKWCGSSLSGVVTGMRSRCSGKARSHCRRQGRCREAPLMRLRAAVARPSLRTWAHARVGPTCKSLDCWSCRAGPMQPACQSCRGRRLPPRHPAPQKVRKSLPVGTAGHGLRGTSTPTYRNKCICLPENRASCGPG